jgi:hypothetical protein
MKKDLIPAVYNFYYSENTLAKGYGLGQVARITFQFLLDSFYIEKCKNLSWDVGRFQRNAL